jgi:S-adenosylmethionine uptake transporter
MPAALRHDTTALPMLLAIAGIALLTGMDAAVKILSQGHGPIDLVAGRFLAGTLVCAPLLLRVPRSAFRPSVLRAHALRTMLVLCTSTLFFFALSRLPLFEAMALTFLSPIFMALLGRMILGEGVARGTAAGIALSFVGVLVIAWGRGTEGAPETRDVAGMAAAVAAALSYALSLVLLRQRTGSDPVTLIIGLQNVMAAVVMVPAGLAFGNLSGLVRESWPLLLAIGVLGTAGHLVYASAFARAAAAKVGTAEFTSLVWAFLLGWLLFSEIPAASAIAGAGLIVAGSLLVLLLPSRTAAGHA